MPAVAFLFMLTVFPVTGLAQPESELSKSGKVYVNGRYLPGPYFIDVPNSGELYVNGQVISELWSDDEDSIGGRHLSEEATLVEGIWAIEEESDSAHRKSVAEYLDSIECVTSYSFDERSVRVSIRDNEPLRVPLKPTTTVEIPVDRSETGGAWKGLVESVLERGAIVAFGERYTLIIPGRHAQEVEELILGGASLDSIPSSARAFAADVRLAIEMEGKGK
jgi:hypothetical protein